MSQTGYIYKLVCKDIDIKECYVGSTKNERVRKSRHKNACNNINNNTHVYKFIRDNGGFENWDMIRIESFSYDVRKELCKRERFHIEELKADLNTHFRSKYSAKIKEYHKKNSEKINEDHKIMELKLKQQIWALEEKNQILITNKSTLETNNSTLETNNIILETKVEMYKEYINGFNSR